MPDGRKASCRWLGFCLHHKVQLQEHKLSYKYNIKLILNTSGADYAVKFMHFELKKKNNNLVNASVVLMMVFKMIK